MMNNINKKRELVYRPRWLANKIREALDVNPVIILTGARQTGKSTLLANEPPFANWRYLTFDDLDTLNQAKKDPVGFLSIETDTVIDEVHRAPEVLTVIKKMVDKNRRLHFVLSGSANLLLMKQVTETLAGRSSYFILLPFSIREWNGEASVLLNDLVKGNFPKETRFDMVSPLKYIFRGFLPPVMNLNNPAQIVIWWDGYVKTYLERDLRSFSAVSSLGDFKRIMEICSIKTGSILNGMDIARTCGMSQPTVHRYINLLEASNLFIKLKPFTKSSLKRVIKSPKGYFLDPGLASYLAGFRNLESIPQEFLGRLFETLILLNLNIYAALMNGTVYYWRTMGGKEKEVDFILEINRKMIAIEVKLSSRVNYSDIQNIQFFLENNKNVIAGIVVYTGREITYFAKNIFCVPWTAL